jgi:release factor glutamine methyltransferase
MQKTQIYQVLWKYFDQYQISQLLQKQTGLSKSQLFLCTSLPRTDDKWLENIIHLWEKKYPFEYIINKAEFFWLELFVDERVLIPRNDTEVMVEQTIHSINDSLWNNIYIDIWTGSSCIPIAVLKNCNKQNIRQTYVIDISSDALDVSKKNINTHELNTEIIQLEWSLLEPFNNIYIKNYSLIISANLPYIIDNDHDNMDKQTLIYEPDLALYGWKETWFELYETLIKQIKELKISNNIETITLFIEIGFDQEIYSQKYLHSLELEFHWHKDNSWIVRCIEVNI